jgi:hypothetical protein
MTTLKNFLGKRKASKGRTAIQDALSLHRRGEERRDGLTLTQASHRLEIEWRARDIHPWDRDSEPEERELLFTEQSIADADAALSRLFNKLPEIDVIEFGVTHPDSHQRILAGTVERAARMPGTRGLSPRTRLWHRGVSTTILAILAFRLVSGDHFAQPQQPTASLTAESSSTSADIFDYVWIGLRSSGTSPPSQLQYRHWPYLRVFKKDLIRDEFASGYTTRLQGLMGFFTRPMANARNPPAMKNCSLPKTKTVTGYT